jgi:hypothetical protein
MARKRATPARAASVRAGHSRRQSPAASRGGNEPAPHRKLVAFDAETWQALDLLARDSIKEFQELADEAFGDLLKKHGRATDLKTALRRSLSPRRSPKRR